MTQVTHWPHRGNALLTRREVQREVERHGKTWSLFTDTLGESNEYESHRVMEWLGYHPITGVYEGHFNTAPYCHEPWTCNGSCRREIACNH